MILHSDGNSFYASCEQIYRPDLRGKPVAVLSNNDGIIIALNKEAKKCGLKRGDVYFKVKYICEAHGVSVFSSNYTLYADISSRIKSIYCQYAPAVEEYSIDECFLFFNDCSWPYEEYEKIGWELKNRIMKEVGMPICVGAAPTKTLAKLYNKKAKEHGGVFVYDGKNVDPLLESVPCTAIWGVGERKAAKLQPYGIRNGLQLKHMSLDIAKKLMTIEGYATVRELNGIPCKDMVSRESHECITVSRQFGVKVYDVETMEIAVVQYSQLAVEKLRSQHSDARGVAVTVSTCNYYEGDSAEKYSNTAFMTLERETSYTSDIVKKAVAGLHQVYRQGFGYKVVMITLYRITKAEMQGLLFIDPVEDVKKRRFMNAVDEITARFGRDSVSLAKGVDEGAWGMRRRMLSPCWTTKLQDVPKVK